MEVGGRGRVYTYRYTVTTKMTCIKVGSDESHFNVSLVVRVKVTGHVSVLIMPLRLDGQSNSPQRSDR